MGIVFHATNRQFRHQEFFLRSLQQRLTFIDSGRPDSKGRKRKFPELALCRGRSMTAELPCLGLRGLASCSQGCSPSIRHKTVAMATFIPVADYVTAPRASRRYPRNARHYCRASGKKISINNKIHYSERNRIFIKITVLIRGRK